MSSQVRDAVLIVNPTAGGGRRMRQLDEARRVLRNAGIETELQNTTAAGEATVMALFMRSLTWASLVMSIRFCPG